MAKSINISALLNLRKGEEKIVALPILYSFFAGAALAFFVTASTSLFLSEFKREILPVSFIASGILMLAAGRIFGTIGKKLEFSKFMIIGVGFLLVSVLILLTLNHIFNAAALIFIIYAWIRIFAYLHAVTFWSLIGRLFSLQQAKRLFSLVTGGEVFGSLLSFFSIPFLLRYVNTQHILLISGILLLVSFFVMILILKKNKQKLNQQSNHKVINQDKKKKKEKGSIFLKNNYYKLFFLIAFLPIFAQFFVEFIFQIQAKNEFPDREMLTQFIGYFFGVSSLIEFTLKTFFAGRLMTKYGIRLGLAAMPAALIFSITLAAIFGFFFGTVGLFFAFIILARLFVRVVRTAFNDPATQILYQPLPEDERLAFQNKVESGPKALATMLAGILLFIFARIESLTLVSFSFFLLGVLFIWYRITVKIYAEYKSVLESVLENSESKTFSGKRALIISLIKSEIHHLKEDIQAKIIKFARLSFPYDFKEQKNIDKDKLKISQIIEQTKEHNKLSIRLEAIDNLKYFKIYKTEKVLRELMYDRDFEIRFKAVALAGETGDNELYEHLFRNFRTIAYRNIAENAMLKVGTKIINPLNKFFPKTDIDPAAQIRLLNVYQAIGGEKSIDFLRTHIKTPNRAVRKKLISVLGQLNYTANYSESLYLSEELEESIRHIVLLSQILIEFKDDENLKKIRRSIEKEKEELIDYMYFILSVLYDSKAVNLIRKNLQTKHIEAGKAKNAGGFALEIADFVLSEKHKKILLPLFNSTDNQELVRKYRHLYPVKKEGIGNRLIYIINMDISVINIFIKARALRLLAKYKDDKTVQALRANMVNPNRLVYEISGHTLFHLNKPAFNDFLQKSSYKYHFLTELEQKLKLKHKTSNLLIFEILSLLSGIELFQNVDENYLITLTEHSEELNLKIGQEICINNDNKDELFLIVTGLLSSKQASYNEGQFICFLDIKPDESELKLTAQEPAFILKTKIWFMTDLLAQSQTFAQNLIQYYQKT